MSKSRPNTDGQKVPNSTTTIRDRFNQVLGSHALPNTLSGISSALAVISTTHGLDTARRRIQSTKETLKGSTRQETIQNYMRVILRQSYGQGAYAQIKDLNAGMVNALKYKSGQIPYRWVAYNGLREHLVEPALNPLLGDQMDAKWRKTLVNGLAGTLTGAGEVSLLYYDSKKIAEQTMSAGSDKRISFAQAYKPIGVTFLRNSIGSFMVFGTETLVSEFCFKNKKKDELSKLEKIGSFVVGGIAGVVVPLPLDTVKVIMQKEKSARTATVIAQDLYQKGGIKPFYQALGLTSVLTGARAGVGLGLASVFGLFFSEQCMKMVNKLNSDTSPTPTPKKY